jgi:hypothetical protein
MATRTPGSDLMGVLRSSCGQAAREAGDRDEWGTGPGEFKCHGASEAEADRGDPCRVDFGTGEQSVEAALGTSSGPEWILHQGVDLTHCGVQVFGGEWRCRADHRQARRTRVRLGAVQVRERDRRDRKPLGSSEWIAEGMSSLCRWRVHQSKGGGPIEVCRCQ